MTEYSRWHTRLGNALGALVVLTLAVLLGAGCAIIIHWSITGAARVLGL